METSIDDGPEENELVPVEQNSIQAQKSVVHPTEGEVITSSLTGNTYTLGTKIGEGNFGVVYSCVDVWENQLAAKVLKPIGTYDYVRDNAQAETIKLIQVRHPFITFFHDAFEYRDTFYIITERCHGSITNLFVLPEFNGPLWIRPVARCLLQAVEYIHLCGFVHQDIHPGNVFSAWVEDEMLKGNENRVLKFKLADLGVAKLVSEVDGRNTMALWMLPPEIINPDEYGPCNHKIDIYHLGLFFLQLASSQELRFTRDEILAGRPREMALALPPPFNFALEKALRRRSLFRTASAMELWRDLNSPPELPYPQIPSLEIQPPNDQNG